MYKTLLESWEKNHSRTCGFQQSMGIFLWNKTYSIFVASEQRLDVNREANIQPAATKVTDMEYVSFWVRQLCLINQTKRASKVFCTLLTLFYIIYLQNHTQTIILYSNNSLRSSSRPISNSQLHTSLCFHLCPIYLIVSKGSLTLSSMDISSWGGLHA